VHLATEKDLEQANARIRALEGELEALRVERDRRSGPVQTMLPPVIDKKDPQRWWFSGV